MKQSRIALTIYMMTERAANPAPQSRWQKHKYLVSAYQTLKLLHWFSQSYEEMQQHNMTWLGAAIISRGKEADDDIVWRKKIWKTIPKFWKPCFLFVFLSFHWPLLSLNCISSTSETSHKSLFLKLQLCRNSTACLIILLISLLPLGIFFKTWIVTQLKIFWRCRRQHCKLLIVIF